MFFQIEITTACNFRCFYCIGRSWRPRHMTPERFDAILRALPPGRHTVSLQGEGEPLVHPRFWAMAEAVRAAGHVPYTITNASRIDAGRAAALFPVIGVSLDTLDAGEAERIGRLRLDRVLANFASLVEAMGPERIVVHTVAFGQDLRPLRVHLGRLGVDRHLVQPLQSKRDYRRRYPGRAHAAPRPAVVAPCRYLATPVMRYFTIDGAALPCCFIKDASSYRSDVELRTALAAGVVPAACVGCREIGGRAS